MVQAGVARAIVRVRASVFMEASIAYVGAGPPRRNFSFRRGRRRLTRVVARLLIVCAVLAASPAAAGPQLAVSGELPCSRDELAAALDLRVGDVAVRVHGTGDRVRVEIDGRDRVVTLEGARGTAAARRIALVAEDLALPELP